eukprot:205055_1
MQDLSDSSSHNCCRMHCDCAFMDGSTIKNPCSGMYILPFYVSSGKWNMWISNVLLLYSEGKSDLLRLIHSEQNETPEYSQFTIAFAFPLLRDDSRNAIPPLRCLTREIVAPASFLSIQLLFYLFA